MKNFKTFFWVFALIVINVQAQIYMQNEKDYRLAFECGHYFKELPSGKKIFQPYIDLFKNGEKVWMAKGYSKKASTLLAIRRFNDRNITAVGNYTEPLTLLGKTFKRLKTGKKKGFAVNINKNGVVNWKTTLSSALGSSEIESLFYTKKGKVILVGKTSKNSYLSGKLIQETQ